MAQRREIITVYAAGLVQGVGLVTFPAASAVFTSSAHYGLTSTEYGAMFVPQAIMAIVASLLGAGLRSRLGTKRIYLLGLVANLLAMTLLVASRFAISEHSLAYAILLVATSCMGVGFGFTVPALNTSGRGVFSRDGGQGGARSERALRIGNGAGSGLCRALCRTRSLVGPACACGSPTFRAACAKCQGKLERSRIISRRSNPERQISHAILDVRHFCPALRRVRNREWQLGFALSDEAFYGRARPWRPSP